MEDYTTRVELMAIPIVAVIFGIGVVLLVAGAQGPWAWLIVGIAGLVLFVLLAVLRTRRHPHPAADTPVPQAARASADGTYRLLVIADESLIDPSFSAQLVAHARGRGIEALVIAPTIGSWLSRWTGDESVHQDARRHLDDTVTALAQAGIAASGEIGADDPLQAADDGLREFAANEIVFVTKPGTSTDWAEKGVVAAARERYPIPVTHIALPDV
jgi:hypothetical protein